MPERIVIPGPDLPHEFRQLALAVADLHYVTGVIVENAKELAAGEAVDQLSAAWKASQESLRGLVDDLYPAQDANRLGSLVRFHLPPPTSPAGPAVPPASAEPGQIDLRDSELFGEVGELKRSTLSRLKDRFMMFWNSEPRSEEKRVHARDAACDYLEFGATVVSSIPGYNKVVEFLKLTKQLVGVRAKRGT